MYREVLMFVEDFSLELRFMLVEYSSQTLSLLFCFIFLFIFEKEVRWEIEYSFRSMVQKFCFHLWLLARLVLWNSHILSKKIVSVYFKSKFCGSSSSLQTLTCRPPIRDFRTSSFSIIDNSSRRKRSQTKLTT